jgi:hypothetical protein
MERAKRLKVGDGSFALSGYAVGWLEDEVIIASTGVFTQLRSPAKLKRRLIVAAGLGEFSLTGEGADLVNRHMTAAAAAFSLTGIDITMNAGIRMLAEPGSFSLVGQDMLIVRELIASLTAGEFAVTGSSAGLNHGYIIGANAATFTLSGIAIDLGTYDLRGLAGDESGNVRTLAGDEAGNNRRI